MYIPYLFIYIHIYVYVYMFVYRQVLIIQLRRDFAGAGELNMPVLQVHIRICILYKSIVG